MVRGHWEEFEAVNPAGILLEDCVRQTDPNLRWSHPCCTVLGFCFRGTIWLAIEKNLEANEDLCNRDREGIWT